VSSSLGAIMNMRPPQVERPRQRSLI
jgi:hypothetical protein